MKKIMSKFKPSTYALMRVIAGAMFLCHGADKLFGTFGKDPSALPFHIHFIAGPVELVTGALIALGLFTPGAAFVACGQMAFAYWMTHGTKSFYPIQNGGELAVLYCFVFLFMAANGSGAWSIDAMRGKK